MGLIIKGTIPRVPPSSPWYYIFLTRRVNHNLFLCFLHIFVPRSKQTYLNHHVSYFYWNNCRISIIYSMYTVDIFIHIYLYVASLPFVFHPFQRWNFPTVFFRSPGASRLAGCLSCGRGGKTPAGGSDVFFAGFLGVYVFWSFFWGVDFCSIFWRDLFFGSFTP